MATNMPENVQALVQLLKSNQNGPLTVCEIAVLMYQKLGKDFYRPTYHKLGHWLHYVATTGVITLDPTPHGPLPQKAPKPNVQAQPAKKSVPATSTSGGTSSQVADGQKIVAPILNIHIQPASTTYAGTNSGASTQIAVASESSEDDSDSFEDDSDSSEDDSDNEEVVFTTHQRAAQTTKSDRRPLGDWELDLLTMTVESKLSLVAGPARTAPLLTHGAIQHYGGVKEFDHLSLFAGLQHQIFEEFTENPADPRLYLNVNSPFTAVLCGVQGGGKSHTLSVMLENCLLEAVGPSNQSTTLAGLVFHYDSGGVNASPSEVAYLSKALPGSSYAGVPTTVFVSPTALATMKKVYAVLPNVTVKPFGLRPEDLNAQRILSIMEVDPTNVRSMYSAFLKLAYIPYKAMPLYLSQVVGILEDLGSEGFSIRAFQTRLAEVSANFSPIQKEMLAQRIWLLDRVLKKKGQLSIRDAFASGTLVVVDLTDPFMAGGRAAALFDIALGLFVECGGSKVVAVDEAHKYLTGSVGGDCLTETLLSVIRQQRHLGIRVIISTQEPTVLPSTLIELANIVVAHRFTSPAWAVHLRKHLVAPKDVDLFEHVVRLATGEALLFSPTAVALRSRSAGTGSTEEVDEAVAVGLGFFKVKTRSRLTVDGGASVLAIPSR